MACETHFDPGLEWGCIKELIGIVRAGEIRTRAIESIKIASWIVGCALDQFDDRTPVLFGAAEAPSTLDGCCAWLLASEPESGQVMALNPVIVAVLMRLVELLLRELLT